MTKDLRNWIPVSTELLKTEARRELVEDLYILNQAAINGQPIGDHIKTIIQTCNEILQEEFENGRI